LAGLLPGRWVFRLGEWLGVLAWHILPVRRRIVLRNLRIAFAGEMTLAEIHALARESFRRTGANLVSAAHTARLAPEKLHEIIHIENLEVLESELAKGRGVVILLAHMGNWEVLSRFVHLFPPGTQTGAFYRPLNNPLMDERILRRRQADGTRMFSKRDNPLHVAAFLRQGGLVGILADQRVGSSGEAVEFFGRHTRASPLPSLLARRAKCPVLALALNFAGPGRWRAVFTEVEPPPNTSHCMRTLEQAMKVDPADVFWLQDRWKLHFRAPLTIRDWLGPGSITESKPHRALLWLAAAPTLEALPERWCHPAVNYEVALTTHQNPPCGLPESARIHQVGPAADRRSLFAALQQIDGSDALPIDFILAPKWVPGLAAAAKRLAIPIFSLE
jgi:KDO2-lipid IV(A) lauroyltransferase